MKNTWLLFAIKLFIILLATSFLLSIVTIGALFYGMFLAPF